MSEDANAQTGDVTLRRPWLGARLLAARIALAWERLWPLLWPVAGIVGLFVAVALFDLLPLLAGWLHALVLAGFVGAFGWFAWRAVRSFEMPDAASARRRLERRSGLEHRPLQVLEDRLGVGADDPEAAALWRLHRRRMAEAARRLRVGFPTPGLARLDPLSLRGALLLVLVVSAAVAGPNPEGRLARSVTPQIAAFAALPPAKLELWITPPAYTGLAPLFPKSAAEGDGSALTVPLGSVLVAQVAGGRGTPELVLDKDRTPFESVDPANSRITATVANSGRLAVEQNGEPLGEWSVTVVPDMVPAVAFAKPPAPNPRGALEVPYTASDDYGLESVAAEIRRTYERGEVVGKEVTELDLPLPALNARTANETGYHDLSPHHWAGLPVVMRLRAKDGAGQVGYSEEVKLVLPERQFRHPVARAIVEQRKRLTTEPERRESIASGIEDIAARPDAFDHDIVTFLALVTARSRLLQEKEDGAIPPVRDLLWDTALRVEDGQLSIASRELRRAQQELMKALAENASDAELERLMRQLENALNRFLEELAQQLRNPDQQAMPFDPNMRLLESTDLQRMLDQIRNLMRSGAREAARQMLAQLQNLLENLRNGRMFSSRQGNSQAGQMMRQLDDLIRRQGQLLDQTFRQSRGGMSGPQMDQSRQGAATQRQLREALRALQRMLGQMGQMTGRQPGQAPGQALDRAGRFMGESAGALDRNAPGDAVGPQGQALDQLQQAGRSMMQQLMNQFGRQTGMGMGRRFNPLRQRRDPLGRYLPGQDGIDTRDIMIPDEGAVQRAQKILEELRRRAGQNYRPRIELDYIDRLLRRF